MIFKKGDKIKSLCTIDHGISIGDIFTVEYACTEGCCTQFYDKDGKLRNRHSDDFKLAVINWKKRLLK